MKIFPLGYATTTTAIDNKYDSKIEEKQIENILFHSLVSIFLFTVKLVLYIITTTKLKPHQIRIKNNFCLILLSINSLIFLYHIKLKLIFL